MSAGGQERPAVTVGGGAISDVNETMQSVVRTPGPHELQWPCFMLAAGRREHWSVRGLRMAPQRHYSIDVVEAGLCELSLGVSGDTRLAIPAGHAFVIVPGTHYTYTAGAPGLTAAWVDFIAPDLERFLEPLSIERLQRPFPIAERRVSERLQELIRVCARDAEGTGLWASQTIYALALELSVALSDGEDDRTAHPAVTALLARIQQDFAQTLSLDVLATSLHMSPTHLCRLFKRETGQSPIAYLVDYRIRRAAGLLAGDPELPIRAVAARVGYDDANYFTRLFKQVMGVAPGAYRKLGRR